VLPQTLSLLSGFDLGDGRNSVGYIHHIAER
jgi:hypothetical protein